MRRLVFTTLALTLATATALAAQAPNEALGTAHYRLWAYQLGGQPSPPVAAASRAYVGGPEGRLVALDEASGEVLWQFAGDGRVRQPAAVDGERVYFGAGDLTCGTVYALNRQSGELLWSQAYTGSLVAAPVSDGTRLYLSLNSQSGHIIALDASTGDRLWEFAAGHYLSGQPVVVDGRLLCGTTLALSNKFSFLYALDAAGGRREWSTQLSGYVAGLAPADDGLVVVACGGAGVGGVYGLDAGSGQQRWGPYLARPFNFWSPPAVRDGTAYLLNKGTVFALDTASGLERWRTALPLCEEGQPLPVSHAPLVGSDYVYVSYAHVDPAATSGVYILDRLDGVLRRRHETGTTLVAAPVTAAGGLLWAGTSGSIELWRQLLVVVNGNQAPAVELSPYLDAAWRSWAPVRPLLEAAGYRVSWCSVEQEVRAERAGGPPVILKPGNSRMWWGGSALELGGVVEVVDGRTVVPVRAFIEGLGGTVKWEGASLTIRCTLP